jgi:RNA polymerase sigma-70 factor, ECF subfamily
VPAAALGMAPALVPSMNAATDDILFERARRGDMKALDMLVRRELPRVQRLLGAWLGARSDLDDLVQIVFEEFCGAIGEYRGDGSTVSAYICGYAKVVALRARRPPAWDRRRAVLDFEPGDEAIDLEESTVAREQVRRLRFALRDLSPAKREALVWWALEGKSLEEISRLSGASISAVRSRIFYAQKELRRMAGRDPYLSELVAA